MNNITFIKKDKNKYIIKILSDNEERTFKISEDLLIESKFINLKEISDEELKTFLNKLPYDSLLLDSLKYIDKKMRTKKEIKDHLFTLTSSENLINSVIDNLTKKGLINDSKYFELITSYLVNEKMYGPLKLNQELEELGLQNFNYEYDRLTLKDNINSLTVKFNQKDNSSSYQSKVIKAKRFLLSKGYPVDLINSLFNYSLISVKDELNNLAKDIERLKLKEDDLSKIKNKLLLKGYKKEDIEEALND